MLLKCLHCDSWSSTSPRIKRSKQSSAPTTVNGKLWKDFGRENLLIWYTQIIHIGAWAIGRAWQPGDGLIEEPAARGQWVLLLEAVMMTMMMMMMMMMGDWGVGSKGSVSGCAVARGGRNDGVRGAERNLVKMFFFGVLFSKTTLLRLMVFEQSSRCLIIVIVRFRLCLCLCSKQWFEGGVWEGQSVAVLRASGNEQEGRLDRAWNRREDMAWHWREDWPVGPQAEC